MADPAHAPGATIDMSITGMTCSSCSTRVQRRLRRADGVIDASVNHATGVARLEVEPHTDAAQLAEIVRSLGFGVVEETLDHPIDEGDDAGAPYRVAAGLIGSISLMAVMVLHMLHSGTPAHPDLPGMNHAVPADATTLPELPQIGAALIAAFVLVYTGGPYFAGAARTLRSRGANMDVLVAIGSLAAFGYSCVVLVRGGEHLYFETAAMIITLIALGRLLEGRARVRAGSAMRALMDRVPPTATVERDGVEREEPLAAVRVGDIVVVRESGVVPVDGSVLSGSATVDESMLTGEAMPADRTTGAEVAGGTIVQSGFLRIAATSSGHDSTIGRIARMVADAQLAKARVQRYADAVASWFVPAIIGIAALTVIAWGITTGSWTGGIIAAIGVLVVACPCALGLATPAAIVVGTGRGAELGIIIKGGPALERACRVSTVVLDKTGTVTTGELDVEQVVLAAGGVLDDHELLRLVAAAEQLAAHPVASAIRRHVAAAGIAVPTASGSTEVGVGVTATVESHEIVVGRQALLDQHGVTLDPELVEHAGRLAERGLTVAFASVDGRDQAVIALRDTMRPGAPDAVRRLRSFGAEVVLLSGDEELVAAAFAQKVGIERVIGGVRPEEKLDEIRRLQAAGEVVAMVGDGLNDGPALAAADVAITVDSATDLAVEAADVVLTRSDLRALPTAMRLARATIRTIRSNMAWAFGYNLVTLPLAATGVLPPVVAAAAMAASSIIVVGNSLRLRRFSAG